MTGRGRGRVALPPQVPTAAVPEQAPAPTVPPVEPIPANVDPVEDEANPLAMEPKPAVEHVTQEIGTMRIGRGLSRGKPHQLGTIPGLQSAQDVVDPRFYQPPGPGGRGVFLTPNMPMTAGSMARPQYVVPVAPEPVAVTVEAVPSVGPVTLPVPVQQPAGRGRAAVKASAPVVPAPGLDPIAQAAPVAAQAPAGVEPGAPTEVQPAPAPPEAAHTPVVVTQADHAPVVTQADHAPVVIQADHAPVVIQADHAPVVTRAIPPGGSEVQTTVSSIMVGTLSQAAGSGSSTSGTAAGSVSSHSAAASGRDVAQVPPIMSAAVQVEAAPRQEQVQAVQQLAAVVPAAQVTEPSSFRGEKGETIRLMTNFLRVKIEVDFGLFEYHATFVPHLEETRLRKSVMNSLCNVLGNTMTFDGRKLYLPMDLDPSKLSISTNHPNDPATRITVKLVKIITDTQAKIQFYNVLVRKLMIALNYTEINRDFYNPAGVTVVAQYNLEMWPGYCTVVEQYDGGLMLCLNSTCRVMRCDTVLDVLTQLKQRNPNGYKAAFETTMIGKSVLTRYNNKHYKIHDVDWKQNPKASFEKKGQQVTYRDYFLAQHGREIKDLTQPLLVSRIKRRKNDPRGEFYFVSLIPEFCNQSGLTDEMRSNQTLMRDLVTHARTIPNQRYASIMGFLQSIRDSDRAKELMNPWGFGFDQQCVIDNGRIIVGPTLQFATFSLKSASADFGREATSNKCFAPIILKKFIVFCTNQDRNKTEAMITQYRQVAAPLGITFGPPPDIVTFQAAGRGVNAAEISQALRKTVGTTQNVQFIMVILPVAKDDLYAAVKKYCLIENPMPSQVILGKTLANDKKLRPIMQKVALQVNCKLGGAVWALNIPLKDLIMFVGIDAHHDPGAKKKSVLALVASMNNYCTEYYSRIINQAAHQESGDAIRPVFNQALQAFFMANGRYPDRIVIFRDGVGDGALETVRTGELNEIRQIVKTTCQGNPKLLFIVVQKRINERMFAIKPGRQLDNPPSGTILDHTITRPGMYDFFLVSQTVRQGTVGPSHFVVLEDSGEGKPDLVQRFAYATTFMYFNWPGTVRVPAMCQYAHKLAMLVGQHLPSEPKDTQERLLYYL